MQASIHVSREPSVQYLLRIGDTCLILAQRLAEWCGHAPIPEEDIALTNMALACPTRSSAMFVRAMSSSGAGAWPHHSARRWAWIRQVSPMRSRYCTDGSRETWIEACIV